MKVLITGAHGQVGQALLAGIPAGMEVCGVSRDELDIADRDAVNARVSAFRPDVILNAAAYTAVDKAESEPELALAGNEIGPRNLAHAARDIGKCRLIHVSTDFVFDGLSPSPYKPDAPAHPLNVYGRTKLGGELAVAEILGDAAVILRTSWVYAPSGRNFLRTMLKLMGEHHRVRVVADQIGTPSASHSVAGVLWHLATLPKLSGVFHWADAGVASWFDFAVAIAEEAVQMGVLSADVEVIPIATEEYPTAAKRPSYSVLDTRSTVSALGVAPVHWRRNLRRVMGELSRG